MADEQFVSLLARLLKAGVIVNGVLEKTTKGCPQGSPLSPMLSNIVLDELDHKLEERNLGYCRWADDFVIVVQIGESRAAGDGGDDPVSGGRTWAYGESGEESGCTDQGDYLSGVSAPEGEDPGQQQGPYPV